MANPESVVLRIEAQTGSADRSLQQHAAAADRAMTAVERSASKAEAAIRQASVVVVDKTALMSNGTRNLGRQFADVGASLASGSSPFMVLAQQAPQVADALTDMGGRAGKVAAFFTGPWGAALFAAGSVIGVLAGKVLEGGDTVEGLTAKLEANAAKARMAADAQKIFETSLYGAADASAKLSKQLAQQNQTQLQVAQSALAAAQAIRQQNIQNLRKEITDAASARRIAQSVADPSNFVQGGTVGGSSGFGQSLARGRATEALTKAVEREKVATQGLVDATKAVVEARVPLLDVKALASSDASAASALRHQEALGRLRDEFRRTGDESAYLAGRTRIENQLTAEQEAIQKRESDARKAGTQAKRDAAKASREAAKEAREEAQAQRELQQTLERVVSKYDPLRAIALETGRAMADIDKLRFEGLITATDALTYKLSLAREQAKAVADSMWKQQEQRWIDVGFTAQDMDGSRVRKDIDQRVEQEREANQRIADDFRQKQESQIRTLATIFEDGFRGGTDAIWQDFKTIGLRILAEMIARWAVAKLSPGGAPSGSGGGDIGSLLATATRSVLGFEGGGYTGDGPRSKVAGVVHKGEWVVDADTVKKVGTENLRALGSGNGRAIAAISAAPNISASATPRQTIVHQTVQVDARSSVNPEGFAQQILSVSGRQAQAAAAQAGQAAIKGVPARFAQYQKDGN